MFTLVHCVVHLRVRINIKLSYIIAMVVNRTVGNKTKHVAMFPTLDPAFSSENEIRKSHP